MNIAHGRTSVKRRFGEEEIQGNARICQRMQAEPEDEWERMRLFAEKQVESARCFETGQYLRLTLQKF